VVQPANPPRKKGEGEEKEIIRQRGGFNGRLPQMEEKSQIMQEEKEKSIEAISEGGKGALPQSSNEEGLGSDTPRHRGGKKKPKNVKEREKKKGSPVD